MESILESIGSLVERTRALIDDQSLKEIHPEFLETTKRLSVESHRNALLQLSLGLIRLHSALARVAELPVDDRAAPARQIARLLDSVALEHRALTRPDSIDGSLTELDAPEHADLDVAGPRATSACVLVLDRRRLLGEFPRVATFEGGHVKLDTLSFDDLETLLGAWIERSDVEALVVPVELVEPLRSLALSHRKLATRGSVLNLLAYSNEDSMELRIKALKGGARGFFVMPAENQRLQRRLMDILLDRRLGYRALIIDDDRSTTLTVATVLRRHGMQCDTIEDPTRTLALIERSKPDVIIVDMFMPGMTGLDLLSVLRSHPLTTATPVILLSGDDDIDRRFDTLMAGGDDYLTKPIRPRHLVSAVIGRARRARWMRRELGLGQPA